MTRNPDQPRSRCGVRVYGSAVREAARPNSRLLHDLAPRLPFDLIDTHSIEALVMLATRRWRHALVAVTLIATAGVGCGGDLVAPQPEPPTGPELSLLGDLAGTTRTVLRKTTGLVFGLLRCVPLQGDVTSRNIGPAGGVIRAGEYTLAVPAGALDRTVRITMEQVRDTVNSVRFAPEGLHFARSARLTMSYENCRPAPGGRDHRIVYVDEALRVLETPASRDDRRAEEVSGQIDHFSRYAVAW